MDFGSLTSGEVYVGSYPMKTQGDDKPVGQIKRTFGRDRERSAA